MSITIRRPAGLADRKRYDREVAYLRQQGFVRVMPQPRDMPDDERWEKQPAAQKELPHEN